jgi:flavorubredoxin
VIRTLRKIAPDVTILTTAKAQQMLHNFYDIDQKIQVVKDGETLSTGRMTLQFHSTPFVHWPETMMTYETENRILFSCDGFGGYGALRGAIFDDECIDKDFYEQESLRYYVNIVAKFHVSVLKAIKKLGGVAVDIIAPSHGLIWREHPERIIELYKKWSEYATGETEPGVTLLYGSMYGNTEALMNAVSAGVSSKGVELRIFDVARTHVSYILPSLWVNRGVLFGAPTYEAALFPPIADVVTMAGRKGIKRKQAAMFGSYGWSGGALRELNKLVEPLSWEMVDALEVPGGPTLEELRKAEEFGARFAERISAAK